ncbi:hypothetical protein DFJ74DRAFT_110735 [Hyaloraphidium curvatum]|nr:hypothetical protein DFJ74DRAFT_110735 [Hyaloraphidium curvatum]
MVQPSRFLCWIECVRIRTLTSVTVAATLFCLRHSQMPSPAGWAAFGRSVPLLRVHLAIMPLVFALPAGAARSAASAGSTQDRRRAATPRARREGTVPPRREKDPKRRLNNSLKRAFDAPEGGKPALDVWMAYEGIEDTSILKSQRLWSVATTVSRHALEEKKALRELPPDEEPQRREENLRDLEVLAGRLRWIIEDAASRSLAVPEKVIGWLFQASEPKLDNYAACADLVSFLRKRKLGLTSRAAMPMLSRLALTGNYTAFLSALRLCSESADPFQPDASLLACFLVAVGHARSESSESLPGYPTGVGFVSDLRLPFWMDDQNTRRLFGTRAPHDDVDPLELESDPYESLRSFLSEDSVVEFAELFAPDQLTGANTPVQKTLALVAFAIRCHEADPSSSFMDERILRAAVEVLLRNKHPRLAVSLLQLLTEPPFNLGVPPEAMLLLIQDAGRSRDLPRLELLHQELVRMTKGKLTGHQLRQLITQYRFLDENEVALALLESLNAKQGGKSSFADSLFAESAFRTAAGERPVREVLDELDEFGISLNDTGLIKGLTALRDNGDIEGLKALWAENPNLHSNETAVSIMASAFANAGQLDAVINVIRALPKELRSSAPVWGIVIRALNQRLGEREQPEPDSEALLTELCLCVLQQRTLDKARLPETVPSSFPLLGVRAPLPGTGVLLNIGHVAADRDRGEHGAALVQELRSFFARSGRPDAEAMSTKDMLGHFVILRRRSRYSEDARPRDADADAT